MAPKDLGAVVAAVAVVAMLAVGVLEMETFRTLYAPRPSASRARDPAFFSRLRNPSESRGGLDVQPMAAAAAAAAVPPSTGRERVDAVPAGADASAPPEPVGASGVVRGFGGAPAGAGAPNGWGPKAPCEVHAQALDVYQRIVTPIAGSPGEYTVLAVNRRREHKEVPCLEGTACTACRA